MTTHAIFVEVPSIPHAPKHVTPRAADADYYRSAARSIRYQAQHGDAFAGSNVTEAVARLCDTVAEQLATQPADGVLAGATDPGKPNTSAATPGEFAARWNAWTEQQRADALATLAASVGEAFQCWTADHVGRLEHAAQEIAALREQLAAAQAVIAKVRESARAGLEDCGDDYEDFAMGGVWVFETLSEPPSTVLAEALIDARADARRQIVAQVRNNCTIDWEVMKAGGDKLIYAVADWIENPPEWVPEYPNA